MIGHLARHGVIVQRARLRASIHRVDPVNTAIRRSVTVRRRVYHAHGHHKQISWGLVTSGGSDGHSQTVVFLRCSDNNRADTVMCAFEEAVQKHGLPSKIRSDLGGEKHLSNTVIHLQSSLELPLTTRGSSGCGGTSFVALHPYSVRRSTYWKRKMYLIALMRLTYIVTDLYI